MSVNWNTKFSMRAILTFVIVGCFIGGSGIIIVYEAMSTHVVKETKFDNGTSILNYAVVTPLDDSKLFNLWLGAVLGYAGSVVTFWYKADETSDNDNTLKKVITAESLKKAVADNKLTQEEADKITKSLKL